MNSAPQQPWSQPPPERGDSMAHMHEPDLDDFGNLFEFGDLDLDHVTSVDSAAFTSLPDAPFSDMVDSQVMRGTPSARDFGSNGQEQYAALQKASGPSAQQQQQQQQPLHIMQSSGNAFAPDSMYQHSVQPPPLHPQQQQQQQYSHGIAYHFHGKQPQAFPLNQHIPPTPNSFEMHGQTGKFPAPVMDPRHQAMLEQRYQLRPDDDAIIFTPIASPAGTPQYNAAQQPEYTVPGAYFSPLTSPMLHAQNAQQQHPHQQPHHTLYATSSTAPSSSGASPLDSSAADVDMLGGGASPAQEPVNARTRKKSERRKTPSQRLTGDLMARVKQSPASKAVKRKSATMLSSMSSLDEHDNNILQHPSSAKTRISSSEDGGSISPEPLSEALMGPPPRPASSAARSPGLAGRSAGASPVTLVGAAATPKSLLSMRGPQSGATQAGSSTGSAPGAADGMLAFEDIQLPEAASTHGTRRPSLSQINTQIPPPTTSSDHTPILASRKTPKLGPLSTPSSSTIRPLSTSTSPSTATTPMASTPGALLKGARGAKKRSSISASSSSVLSPALRPKISPSIKPLLPEGSLNSQTHALLLASKSNYQNLLEGNHLPGVSYPDSLSTGLTSKRTSHKVAEQGRRNRINEALREMQSLLPKPAGGGTAKNSSNGASSATDAGGDASPDAAADAQGDKDDSGAKGNNNSSSSKAATVECANEFIRALIRENSALRLLKAEHEALKRSLASDEKPLALQSQETAAIDEPLAMNESEQLANGERTHEDKEDGESARHSTSHDSASPPESNSSSSAS